MDLEDQIRVKLTNLATEVILSKTGRPTSQETNQRPTSTVMESYDGYDCPAGSVSAQSRVGSAFSPSKTDGSPSKISKPDTSKRSKKEEDLLRSMHSNGSQEVVAAPTDEEATAELEEVIMMPTEEYLLQYGPKTLS